MTNQQHPITPPDWLVEEWANAAAHEFDIATQAAQWGSDQELEACCEWLDQNTGRWDLLVELRAARRPKPPSLKDQALKALDNISIASNTIRRALEQLDD
jgi:hypothetical protein